MESSADYTRVLLIKACDDAYVVTRLCPDPGAPDWVIGFHAQQAVEKSLKAALTLFAIEYPRTHNIEMLLELLRQNGIPTPPDAQDLPDLIPFGVALRYDDSATTEDVPLDRAWASRAVSATIAWAKSQTQQGSP